MQIEDALKAYASDGDLMALFVNGEIRALAKPAVSVGGGTATGKFLMKAYGNETGSETVNMSVEPLLTKVGLTPVSGNMVAAFVGEECRGTVSLASSGSTQLLIFGRNAGESLTLKYYDATAGKLYTIPDAVKL